MGNLKAVAAQAVKSAQSNDVDGALLTAVGMTEAEFRALSAAAQAALVQLQAKAASKDKALGIKLYANGCEQGPIVTEGDRKGQRNACFGDIGARLCPHNKPLKGNIGITGLGRNPVTLYAGQIVRAADEGIIDTWIAESRRLAKAGIGVK